MKHKLTATASVRAQPLAQPSQALAGFTLLELMLVMVLGAGAATMGLQQYAGYKYDLDLQVAQVRINALHQALSGFYALHCLTVEGLTASSRPAVTRDLLLTSGLLTAVEVSVNPFGGHFVPAINWDTVPVTVSVSTPYNGMQESEWVNQYPPTHTDDTNFIWSRTPSYANDVALMEQRLFTAMYHPSECH